MEPGSGNPERTVQKYLKNLKEVTLMDEKRKGEIAFALLKCGVSRDSLLVALGDIKDLKRKLDTVAKATGIPLHELEEFVKIFLKEVVEEAFPGDPKG
jgi:hypothetical protein